MGNVRGRNVLAEISVAETSMAEISYIQLRLYIALASFFEKLIHVLMIRSPNSLSFQYSIHGMQESEETEEMCSIAQILYVLAAMWSNPSCLYLGSLPMPISFTWQLLGSWQINVEMFSWRDLHIYVFHRHGLLAHPIQNYIIATCPELIWAATGDHQVRHKPGCTATEDG